MILSNENILEIKPVSKVKLHKLNDMLENNYSELENEIINLLDQVAKSLVKSDISNNGAWTNQIMTELTKIAYEKKYWVWSKKNSVDDTINEFIYDMLWCETFDEKGHEFKTIHLILECEWNTKMLEIKYDFYKLLVGRAKHRVFIFQGRNITKIFDELEGIINKSSIAEKGDRFLILGYDDYHDEIEFIKKLVVKAS